MKKWIFYTMLFAVFTALSINAQIKPTTTERLGAVHVDTLRVNDTTAVSGPDHGNAAWVQFMHEDANAIVWFGGSDSITTTRGWGALQQYDTSERYPVTNTNVFYFISDSSSVLIKILWGKDGTPD